MFEGRVRRDGREKEGAGEESEREGREYIEERG